MPISRVRSAHATSMMFDDADAARTTSDTAGRHRGRTGAKTVDGAADRRTRRAAASEVGLATRLDPVTLADIPLICETARCVVSALVAEQRQYSREPGAVFVTPPCIELIGISTMLSRSPPKGASPFDFSTPMTFHAWRPM